MEAHAPCARRSARRPQVVGPGGLRVLALIGEVNPGQFCPAAFLPRGRFDARSQRTGVTSHSAVTAASAFMTSSASSASGTAR